MSSIVIPNLPPLSNSKPARHRISRSKTYDKASPEWYWKVSPTLPQLWIRDGKSLTPEIVAELDKAWVKYGTLSIPGKGDGADLAARTRTGRKILEEEYSKLDHDTRRAKEVALARYDPFVIRGTDGSLDYHTEVVRYGGEDREKKKCNLM
jgi:hypothetical protein